MLPAFDEHVSRFMFDQTRVNLSLLTQFITGHNYLRYHKFKSGQFLRPPKCRRCQVEPEDSWHLLANCETLERTRQEIFLLDEVTKLPNPKLALNFIRCTRIVKLMEPEEEWNRSSTDQSVRTSGSHLELEESVYLFMNIYFVNVVTIY